MTAPLTRGAFWVRHRKGERYTMKATGIVRSVEDFGRIVIPKEIRRTLKIKEGAPLLTTLASFNLFFHGIMDLTQRITGK